MIIRKVLVQYSVISTFFLCVVFLLCVLSSNATAEQLRAGSGRFVFKTPQNKKEIQVWYYKPVIFKDTSQIVFVMHGLKRNGEKYRDAWIPHAKQGNFLLLVPEFSKRKYPGSAGYNLGNMFSSSGTKNDEASWSFTVIEDLFDHVKSISRSQESVYSIYGHSAGAQFVHRLVIFKPDARIRTAIAANAGWYTMPTEAIVFPYGLRNSGKNMNSISDSFAKKLIILLGEKDTDENHKYLRKTAEAMAQGKHRVARGHSFYNTAIRSAKEHKVQLEWKIKVISGVGHSNSRMSTHASKLLR